MNEILEKIKSSRMEELTDEELAQMGMLFIAYQKLLVERLSKLNELIGAFRSENIASMRSITGSSSITEQGVTCAESILKAMGVK